MTTKFDTKDWELHAPIGYRLKPHACNYIACPTCGGRGVIGGGFKSSEETCGERMGRKKVHDGYDAEAKPELPRGLVEALRTTLKTHEPPHCIVGVDHHPV